MCFPAELPVLGKKTDNQIPGAVLVHERRKDPCSDPEFELHNHVDYARQICFSVSGL